MKNRYLFPLNDASLREKGGSKAKNLRFLLKKHYRVPGGFVLCYDALTEYRQKGTEILIAIEAELKKQINPEMEYAVRSSASLEDQEGFSCAGAFESHLRVQGTEELLEAIKSVWQSLNTERLRSYCSQSGLDTKEIRMAVILQEMVEAQCSGVAFSKNPLTGFSEIIIEAAEGTGEDQVKEKKSPERWVEKWGKWKLRGDQGILEEKTALELTEAVRRLSKDFGRPVDVEWAYDGKELYFLQVRPITRLDIPIYSNKITKEMLPGIIKPLVWSVNTSFINKIWQEILTRLTGEDSIDPSSLTGYYYGRAYFNMALFGQVFESMGIPYEGLELLLGLEEEGERKPHLKPGMKALRRAPSLLRLTQELLMAEKRYKKNEKEKRRAYERISEMAERAETKEECLLLTEQILKETESVAYFNIILPMLLMMMHRMLKSALEKYDVDIRQLTLLGVEEAARKYSPHYHLAELRRKYRLPREEMPLEEEKELKKDLEIFLRQFGHFSDSGNDCSKVPWRETPELLHHMLLVGEREKGEDNKTTFEDLPLPLLAKWRRRGLYRRTSSLAVTRESVSSLYTFGYGQFRTVFLKLGELLLEEGLLEAQEDIFYLYFQELEDHVLAHKDLSFHSLVEKRKEELDFYKDKMVPDIIVGREQPPLKEEARGDLEGIPTSLGVYTGPARVLLGLSDFHRLSEGDVLIIPYSDVGWSPLFARAGAVIAESGGILSHSSIVAREYRIPAVVSVSGALRIEEGSMVTVDGYSGKIMLEKR